jgi:hypothetical protein
MLPSTLAGAKDESNDTVGIESDQHLFDTAGGPPGITLARILPSFCKAKTLRPNWPSSPGEKLSSSEPSILSRANPTRPIPLTLGKIPGDEDLPVAWVAICETSAKSASPSTGLKAGSSEPSEFSLARLRVVSTELQEISPRQAVGRAPKS